MLYLCLTLDYELFMGKNYVSYEDVMLKPSYNLMDMFEAEGVRGTFFSDVCFSLANKNNPNREIQQFIPAFETQMRSMIKRGHDVQLHIHPHWFHANCLNDRSISMDTNYYRLHSYGFNTSDPLCAQNIIGSGIDYLNGLLKPVDENYKCIAYRAGGFCLQPEKELLEALYSHGIRIDSSVAMFFKYQSNEMQYDYTSPKISSPCFYIPVEKGLDGISRKPCGKAVFEVAIGGYKTKIIKNFISKKNKPMPHTPNGTGMALSSAAAPLKGINKIAARINGMLNTPLQMSFDFFSSNALEIMIKKFAQKYNYSENDVYVALIGHPKSQYASQIKNLSQTIHNLRQDKNIRFVTMQDIYKAKGLNKL